MSRLKSSALKLLALSALLMGPGCSEQLLSQIASTGLTSTSIESIVSQFLALPTTEQTIVATEIGSTELQTWAQSNQSTTTAAKQQSLQTLLSSKASLSTQLNERLFNKGNFQNRQNQTGMPQPGQAGRGPGGLPPNFTEIQTQYPELATALEELQSLGPEERRTKMEALFQAHPEWQAVMMPPQGLGPGGPGQPPPSGMPFPSATPTATP
ncbi:hypothetical protein COW36_22535 [bacterium (Candidatus Blackallbacteria) CG17_big_fil_post_rev_8_21_14_2_50_48_46]|uniref:DUF3300 domain-containing protein n=1 Tax=bacterium (Candidatus Blackallbacteria) CG17_big_fil_post_rev_8_21_14_2_50_48_46 TaxID=2014261 RepID=A0A2M7FYM6_9BACT|nr:MAG: hypothetical protein COW64_07305 [bacterium (Candidatus Blackallbacteria) CG18_big_fil_WC_8_21_14_2_50_49_26]PIW14157.1 MAG: hypothetical protein COW36_22535 [bacterium (Candidatus Blackallbacteria) CG17_big_fil_post_rev_8_21_14_2_50_48_46]PIW46698.1 MAG: hypothetical protein COW20_14810 [bacterium (Candidatus Blackallbacteria) CG13_big_fil_rev_8_21_14_2_50_49_14]